MIGCTVIRVLLTALALLALSRVASATDDKSAGKELIDKARRVSDIRADGAPAFRMEGTFKITPRNGGERTEGTYTEVWVSNRKWRREVQTSSFHRIAIRSNAARWLADAGTDRPEPALHAPLTLLFRNGVPDPEVSGTSERQLNSAKVPCVESGLRWNKNTDCMDPDTGAFLLRETSFDAFNGGSSAVRHSCVYSEYEKFGDKIFPKFVRCSNSPGEDIELTVTKLIVESSPEQALFVRPPSAIETMDCERTTPPQVVSNPDPEYPAHHKETATVVLSTVVGENGSPKDLQVVRSAGNDFDQAAMNAARRWRFKPSTCDGTAIPARIDIEISFRMF
jgi:TonB family protein